MSYTVFVFMQIDSHIEALLPELSELAYRLTAHPDEQDDLVQEALIAAYPQVEARPGDLGFRAWLASGVLGRVLAWLETRRQWGRRTYQQAMADAGDDEADREAIGIVLAEESFEFDPREHVAFCLMCVGRSLPPHQSAAFLLTELLDYNRDDAGSMLGVAPSMVEALQVEAADALTEHFQTVCRLQNPDHGECSLCIDLYTAIPEDRRTDPLERIGQDNDDAEACFKRRVQIVREASVAGGRGRVLHDFLLRGLNRREQT